MAPRNRSGCFTVLCPPHIGGTTLCLRERTCFSSGRKSECVNGVKGKAPRYGRWLAWINSGDWRMRGIRRACGLILAGLSPLKCSRSSRVSGFSIHSGTLNRTVSAEARQADGNTDPVSNAPMAGYSIDDGRSRTNRKMKLTMPRVLAPRDSGQAENFVRIWATKLL